MGVEAETASATSTPRWMPRMQALALMGCLLFGVSVLLPVMRWNVGPAHSTAGSARVLGDDSSTLVDGGYAGASLVPLSAFVVLVMAVAILASSLGRWVWWVQVAALAVALYYPAWVLYVFLKKLEDEVSPAVGVLVLGAAYLAMIVGTVSGRTDRSSESPPDGA